MKLSKKLPLGILVVLLTFGLLASCGNKNPGQEALADETSSTEQAADTLKSQSAEDTSEVARPEKSEPQEEADQNKPQETDLGKGRKTAPDFTLADLTGKGHTLSAYKGKVVLVDFWATWCGPCRSEIPHLINLYKTHKNQGLVIIGVGLDKKANLEEFYSSQKMNYTVLVDERGVTGKLYSVTGIPRTVIIDKKGRIAFDHTGFAPGMETQMEKEIKTLLAE